MELVLSKEKKLSTIILEKNLALLTDHFYQGCKENCVQELGLEIEHFVVKKDSKKTVSYYEEHGIAQILLDLSAAFSKKEMTASRDLIGMSNKDYNITIEPAGQLEISIAPRSDIAQIRHIYHKFLKLLAPVLEKHGCELVTLGYHPITKAGSLPLIPKKRYEYMDNYFKNTGKYGMNMMRGTASTQISIDYCSEEDFVLKYRVAYILMPALKLLCDNTPVFEGRPQKHLLKRTDIWNNVDPDRTGIIPGLFEDDFGFESYSQYLWNLPLIFVMRDGAPVYTERKTTGELYSNKILTVEEINHILSMTFLDVRLKNYIEMRAADAMPFEYVMAYMALIKGIFFHQEVLQTIACMFPVSVKDILHAQKELREKGYQADIYGEEACEFLGQILEFASEKLDMGEKAYLLPFKELVDRKKTLTEEYYEEYNK